jgi:lysophospholipase L1-like esterase
LLPALAAFVLTGCNTVMIGDSIFNMSRTELGGAVDASDGRGAYNAGLNGQILSGEQAVEALAPTVLPSGWLVIGLGTNDARTASTSDEFEAFVRATVDLLADDRCLAWVIPYNPGFQTQSTAIEAAIREHIVDQPCHALIDWGDTVRAHPELAPDGIHPNSQGREILARMIRAATK